MTQWLEDEISAVERKAPAEASVEISMAATPCPILVVTASVEENAGRVFEAMGAGAVDAVAQILSAKGKKK